MSAEKPGRTPERISRRALLHRGAAASRRVDQCLEVDTVEEWTLGNAMGPGGHPFHIHANPFQVTHYDGEMLAEPVWMDTVNVPAGRKTVTVRMRPRRFTGDSVLHCHILPHEDAGMMQKIRIRPKGECVGSGPATDCKEAYHVDGCRTDNCRTDDDG